MTEKYYCVPYDMLEEGEDILAFGRHVLAWDFATMGEPAYGFVPAEDETRRWISVDDRLPDAGDYVLARVSHPLRGSSLLVANLTMKVDGYFYWMSVDATDIDKLVTHWMPLPQPPEEEND